MANYNFLDAYSSVKTAASSTVGSVEFPVIKVDNFPTTQNVSGSVVTVSTGNQSVSGAVSVSNLPTNQSVSGTVGASIAGTVPITLSNLVSTNNSSASVLGNGGVFTGTSEDVSDYAAITLQTDASHNSATDGIDLQFSTDGTNWDDSLKFTYTASQGARRFQIPVTAKFYRVVYTNGPAPLTHLRLQTILNRSNVLTTIHRVGDSLTTDRSAQLVKAVVAGETTAGGGGMVNVKVSPSGTLETTATQGTDPWIISNSSVQVLNYPTNQSVSGTVQVGNLPLNQNVSGSVIAQLKSSNASVITVGSPVANQSVSGSVGVEGTPTVLQLAGSVLATSATVTPPANQSVSGTVHIDNFSSVIANQGTGFGSVAAHIKSGSVIAVLGGNTSVLTIPKARTSIQGTVALTSTSVTTMVAAGGAGVANHITDIMIANTGAADTLVTFSANGGASVLGYTIAPTLGGSNMNGLVIPIATPANQTFNIQAATATSTLYATVKGYRA